LARLGFDQAQGNLKPYTFAPSASYNEGEILIRFAVGAQVRDIVRAAPSSIQNIQAKLVQAREEYGISGDQIIELRKKISQLPSLERQYKARLVESQLAKTEAGQALLDSLTFDLEDQLRLLS
jgi:hypothetical protein